MVYVYPRHPHGGRPGVRQPPRMNRKRFTRICAVSTVAKPSAPSSIYDWPAPAQGPHLTAVPRWFSACHYCSFTSDYVSAPLRPMAGSSWPHDSFCFPTGIIMRASSTSRAAPVHTNAEPLVLLRSRRHLMASAHHPLICGLAHAGPGCGPRDERHYVSTIGLRCYLSFSLCCSDRNTASRRGWDVASPGHLHARASWGSGFIVMI